MAKFGERLQAIAEFVSQGSVLADIGSDHAYLPIRLYREGRCKKYILTDIKPGPLEKTRASINKALGGIPQEFSLRMGDGLEPISKGEADVCVIAGMGGESIIDILAADETKTRSIKRFIFQPRTKTQELCFFLEKERYIITAMKTAFEKGRYCDIIVSEPQNRERGL